jgi:hypothetical protein
MPLPLQRESTIVGTDGTASPLPPSQYPRTTDASAWQSCYRIATVGVLADHRMTVAGHVSEASGHDGAASTTEMMGITAFSAT